MFLCRSRCNGGEGSSPTNSMRRGCPVWERTRGQAGFPQLPSSSTEKGFGLVFRGVDLLLRYYFPPNPKSNQRKFLERRSAGLGSVREWSFQGTRGSRREAKTTVGPTVKRGAKHELGWSRLESLGWEGFQSSSLTTTNQFGHTVAAAVCVGSARRSLPDGSPPQPTPEAPNNPSHPSSGYH
jgi:hypothetical protein